MMMSHAQGSQKSTWFCLGHRLQTANHDRGKFSNHFSSWPYVSFEKRLQPIVGYDVTLATISIPRNSLVQQFKTLVIK